MEMFVDPQALETAYKVVRALGSLASMVNAYVSLRKRRKDLTPGDRKEILTAGADGASAYDPKAVSIFMAMIPGPVRDAAVKRINKAEERYVKNIGSPNTTPAELDREFEKAQEEICALLSLLRRHNEGEIPDEFKALWGAYRCS